MEKQQSTSQEHEVYHNQALIGSLPSVGSVESLLETLGSKGIDHSQFSILSSDDPLVANATEDTVLDPAKAASASPRTEPLVTKRSVIEGEVLIVGLPAALVVAAILITEAVSPVFATNLFVAIVAGAGVGGIAYLFSKRLARKHNQKLEKQVKRGGILVFVTAMSKEQEDVIRKTLDQYSSQPLATMPVEK